MSSRYFFSRYSFSALVLFSLNTSIEWIVKCTSRRSAMSTSVYEGIMNEKQVHQIDDDGTDDDPWTYFILFELKNNNDVQYLNKNRTFIIVDELRIMKIMTCNNSCRSLRFSSSYFCPILSRRIRRRNFVNRGRIVQWKLGDKFVKSAGQDLNRLHQIYPH